ncbi:hypothetical protein FOMA001_g15942 [Fusarium oxysporum f. sp. matthiolae]|nr:hypothetical protein FOMA001_g15942 [Fusarium oxysporum f. sp. matthiolae]
MSRIKLQVTLIWVVSLLSALFSLASAQTIPNLRVLPLGDSITKGSGSSHGNGYRGYFREKLVAYVSGSDSAVDMVGSLKHGNMADDDHEGHSGEYLREINEYWKLSIRSRPNVVLIHAGTNNMDKERDLDEAPALMRSIVLGIMEQAPEAVVLVAPVIWANDERMNANTNKFNAAIKSMIKTMQEDNRRILEVLISIGLGDLSDKKHPNNGGYQKMANAWFEAIKDAFNRGWLKSPIKLSADNVPGVGLGINAGGGMGSNPVGSTGNAGCQGGNWEKRGTIFDDYRSWESVGTIRSPTGFGKRENVILADLNNDGVADYIVAEDDGTVRAWINGGKPNEWMGAGKINPAWKDVTGNMIRMADVDNDGRADMIVVSSNGAARVWKNTKDGSGLKFVALDSNWATGLESRDKIHFQDMDGDGYADYVIVYSGGAVKWARNTGNNGKDSSKKNWETDVTIAPGPSDLPPNGARLYDLDGDKKSDYIIFYDGGAVKALRNTGNLNDINAGVTGEMIRFADMDGDGLADFLAVASDGSIRMWRNTGAVGSSKGVTLRLADLDGDGKADVVALGSKGRARAWLNKGVGNWEDIGEIAPGFKEDLSSARIEFADVNGDGRDDLLIIYGGGAVKAYLNNGNIPDVGKGRIWQPARVIAPGVGEPGRKVRFADVNGDGYADYLVVFDGGAVDAYLNLKNIPSKGGRIWSQRSTVATGVGQPGSKITFADITGDGRAEYIVQFDGGAANAYNNTGNIPNAGKPRNWDFMGTIAGGVTPQGPVVFADINGDGKDDYLVVFEDGKINAYVNTCDWKPIPSSGSDGGDSDKSEVHDASLGVYMEGCTSDQQKLVAEAWKDAGDVAQVHHQWSPKGKWQDATTMYLGKESMNGHGLFGRPGPEWYTIDRQHSIHFSGFGKHPRWTYAYLYCDEGKIIKDDGLCKEHPGLNAYTWDSIGTFWTNHYVVFCPRWFTKKLSNVDILVELGRDKAKQKYINPWKDSRARTMYHETFHWERTVSDPKCLDYAYAPDKVVERAETGTENAILNAENFALAGFAIYAQDQFGLKEPPIPDQSWALDNEDEGISVLKEAPSGWVEPESVSKTSFKPHPRYNAKKLSDLGTTEPVQFRGCLHEELFATEDQCKTYCTANGCTKTKNKDGEERFECDCGERKKGDCSAGTYSGLWQCENRCDGGKCERELGTGDFNCTGCAKEESKCEDGVYDDFDKCFDNCHQGMCSESAGEDGVTCKC